MNKTAIHVGTSGWNYDDWRGAFYPEGLRQADQLTYYTTQFDAVELNATFYRLPSERAIASWNQRLGKGFNLAVKGPQSITHYKKLRNCEEPLERFLSRVRGLKSLRVILWQLPPLLHKNLDTLEHFLACLPASVRHAVEFRHESWWDEDVRQALARHRVAMVGLSHPSLPDTVWPTTDFLYLRFHGQGPYLYNYDYSRKELAAWAARIGEHLKGRTLYAFFNNDHHAYAPKNAALFRTFFVKN